MRSVSPQCVDGPQYISGTLASVAEEWCVGVVCMWPQQHFEESELCSRLVLLRQGDNSILAEQASTAKAKLRQ
jgi:hypothetical protein